VQPAEQESGICQIAVDRVGAISVVSENDPPFKPGVFQNIDGYREEDGRYAAFTNEISAFIPSQRQFTDPVRTFAYGTDASFYRLNPRMVVKVRGACHAFLPWVVSSLHTVLAHLYM
jgi:D-lactate dehydrogenase